jgi:hypothetical protein
MKRLLAGPVLLGLAGGLASRKPFGRFSGIVLAAGRRIDNPPDPA